MKKVLLSIFAIAALFICANAQSIIDAEEGNPNDFYQKEDVVGKKAMPYPPLRGSDIVWKTTIWRQIDLNENFNQFFYFPLDMETNTQGRISLVNLLYTAAERGDFDVYADDDMNVPQEWSSALSNLQGRRLSISYGEEDEFGDREQIKDTVPVEFDAAKAKLLKIKEFWYIDKQDSRQKVRITGLCFRFSKNVYRGGEENEVNEYSFWVPMDRMSVRNVLINAIAFDDNNDVAGRTYDDVFIQRYFDSYITRESNKYNREISKYLTGEDAILESQRIEDKIFDIENDMWEY